ncbi:hypothetical protein DEO72_LG1g2829 [Vigna unguiculata]|uniref:Uncharacterized protein n=1 Tax=Vigna unguiculata TaxID=3917 RepID=A0A4D6KR90_VIGUN|nr:hypothetical protein DEO72_LG1g2829 [Vigna unguiculata]
MAPSFTHLTMEPPSATSEQTIDGRNYVWQQPRHRTTIGNHCTSILHHCNMNKSATILTGSNEPDQQPR